MTTALVIEEESGIYRGHVHPHDGYFAGDFLCSADRTPEVPASQSCTPSPGAERQNVVLLRPVPGALGRRPWPHAA